ncbi:MAG: molybdopterin-dependent oxidoreductase [Bacteroidales bacterium]|nr:molybdopterin-dependent oxidoreductase [Bacteroidales bacterium]
MNDRNRLTKPLIKENGSFKEISFEEARAVIVTKIKAVTPEQNAFFAGARLPNEELYMIQKLARAGVNTANIDSFHYMGRKEGFFENSHHNVPLDQLNNARQIFILDSEINYEHAVPGFYAQNARFRNKVRMELLTTKEQSSMDHKVDQVTRIRSSYYFIKAAIHHILGKGLENRVFIGDHCEGFESYRDHVLSTGFDELVSRAGTTAAEIVRFAEAFNREAHAVIMYGEQNISGNTCIELRNLCAITGKTGKSASGIIALKEKNNSQGLFDMGAVHNTLVGGLDAHDPEQAALLKKAWGATHLPLQNGHAPDELLALNKIKNTFIFGEDPLGCAEDKEAMKSLLKKTDFLLVQDMFMSETAMQADLIMPASLPIETGGSFSNTQKFIQQFSNGFESPLEESSFEQLKELHLAFGLKADYESPADVMLEAAALMQKPTGNDRLCTLAPTTDEDKKKVFRHGCDYLLKRFNSEWEQAFTE